MISTRQVVSKKQRKSAVDWLISVIEKLPDTISRATVSEWAEGKRILPAGLTSIPGPFRWQTTPYLREIADCFSELSPVNKVAIMKGAQLGFTVGVLENVLGYIIDHNPGPTMFISGDKEMAEAAVEVRIDRMLESAGISHKIFAQSEKKHGRKTGDTKSKKEFPGGFLMAIGPNTGAKLRSFSIKTILFDEVDAYPQETGDEGDPLRLAERRTDTYERTRKLLYISTPLVDQTSRIKPLYESGDQRLYHVPCKHCGEMQPLVWDRLKYSTDEKGSLIYDSVKYCCIKCGGFWTNDDKQWFLERGQWIPQAKASEPGFRSYHLSALYSPVGMRTWGSIVHEWLTAKDDQKKTRTFINTVLGETWQERGESPPWERIMLRREDYLTGTYPSGFVPLLLTAGADVQENRIEVEVVAWGENKVSASIGYFVLDGDTSDIDGAPWVGLNEILCRDYAGHSIMLALVDSGFRTSTVYQFCERYHNGVQPCMGESANAWGRRSFASREVVGYKTRRIDIQTGMMKSEIYGYLQRELSPDGETIPAGYCYFPLEYGEKHFKNLTAEQRVKEKTKSGAVRYVWKQIRERNEQLDCRVYALAALYVLATQIGEAVSPDDPINWPDFWALLKN
ncbi:MAG TPA: phage terminase large subunit family protein [Sedimentisphaerales bacterium]|nr:phage terminase large subunit family protein [Sedimentisphaerales bacterium]